jgi:hypothetical protein
MNSKSAERFAKLWIALALLLVALPACASAPEPTRVPIRALIPTQVPAAQGLDANAAWLFGTATPSPTPTATGTPGPSPTATVTPTPINAETLKGKLLFLSNRPLPATYAPADPGNLKLVSPEMFKVFSQSGGTPVWEYDPTFGKVTPCDPPPAAPTPTPAGATPSALLFGDLSQIVSGRGASPCQKLYDEARQAQTFSPDKRFEVYVGSDPNGGRPQIFVIDHSTNTVKMVTRFGSGVSYAPAFAPDGYHIAFISQAEGPDDIYSVTRDGTELQRLTRLPGQGWSSWEWIKFVSWSPDGQIAFWSNKETGARRIWLMNADGSNLHTISGDPRPAEDWDPVWIR